MKVIKILEYLFLAFFALSIIGFFYGEFTDTPLFPGIVEYMDLIWPISLLGYSICLIYQDRKKKEAEAKSS